MTTTATFINNQPFIMVLNMSQWELIYDLTQAIFQMQVRATPGDALPIYSFASFTQAGIRGAISYQPTAQLLLVTGSYADAQTFFAAGTYAFDVTMEIDDPITGLPVIVRDVVEQGTLTVIDGVTLR